MARSVNLNKTAAHAHVQKARPRLQVLNKMRESSAKIVSSTSSCIEAKDDASNGTREGQWVGVAVSAWVMFLILVWLVRTCTNERRRQKVLRKLCFKKSRNQDMERNTGQRSTDSSIVYYTPNLPPSYEEIMRSPAQYMVPTSPYAAQYMVPTSPYAATSQFRFSIPCRGCIPGRYRSRKSRGSLSMLSISLETIQEESGDASQPNSPSPHGSSGQQPEPAHPSARTSCFTFHIDTDTSGDVSVGSTFHLGPARGVNDVTSITVNKTSSSLDLNPAVHLNNALNITTSSVSHDDSCHSNATTRCVPGENLTSGVDGDSTIVLVDDVNNNSVTTDADKITENINASRLIEHIEINDCLSCKPPLYLEVT
ncbi:uncharacterized protein LOC131944897 [Physella acuta]|uniref:uncharacterized protein LOC131944897 n=1 Tax=Physella acuta TaxID=109671 RepID=UPI0027DE2749|nr:uncharacterized protein LOC131944897 [Physella acuta]